jgi:hypothetical protein
LSPSRVVGALAASITACSSSSSSSSSSKTSHRGWSAR